MKTIITIITIITALLFVCTVAISQDTLYIYNSGAIVYKRAVSTIDSVIFYNSFACGTSTITDIDGNTYNTVSIGSQCWMKENLKVTKYSNGDVIGTTTPATLDISSESTPKYQWAAYNGNDSNVATYGRTYTWYAVTDSRNVCPTGWHVPTDVEWTTLTDYLGGESVAGGKMKEAGTSHWYSPNTGADNSSGFTALAGGNRNPDGPFLNFGFHGYWWSSTVYDTNNAWNRALGCYDSIIERQGHLNSFGFSVRCVKD